MSVEAMAIALHHSKSSGTAKVVLLGIANHDGDAGSFPKVATLAKYANVHPRRVQAAIDRLTELGEIRVDGKAGGMRDIPDHLRPNLYHFTLTCPADCDRSAKHKIAGERVARSRKGTSAAAVDNVTRAAVLTGDENSTGDENVSSTGDENVSSTGDENVSSTGDENVSTKNHQLEPPLEDPLLPSAVVSPAAAEICWACGQPRALNGKYCRHCESNGYNTPIISCVVDGCTSGVRRRTAPGQQHFVCADHKNGPLTERS